MDDDSDLIDELRALAGSSGDAFLIHRNGVRFTVDYTRGSSSSLSFRAGYDEVARADHETFGHVEGKGTYRSSARETAIVATRPLAITLRVEAPADVEAKRAGINVEFQTGDPKFDGAVYVSTPTTDARVLAAVLGPKVREGVLALLVLGFQWVKIDHGGNVEAYLNDFTRRSPRPGRGARAVDAFALVLSDLPRVATSGKAHAQPPGWARDVVLASGILAAIVLVVPGWFGIVELNHCRADTSISIAHGSPDGSIHTEENYLRDGCDAHAGLALLSGLLAAALASALAGSFAKRRLRGRSDSAARITGFRVAVFIVVLVAAFLVASEISFSRALP